jgi:hypothetical protein
MRSFDDVIAGEMNNALCAKAWHVWWTQTFGGPVEWHAKKVPHDAADVDGESAEALLRAIAAYDGERP